MDKETWGRGRGVWSSNSNLDHTSAKSKVDHPWSPTHVSALKDQNPCTKVKYHLDNNRVCFSVPRQVLLKSDRIDVLLSRLLPHGQLLFLNHRFAQSLEKEVAAYMAK